MTTTPSTNNPFDLPELIHSFSKLVSTKDAPTYALVSKAWTDIFTSAVWFWFKVDYGAHPRFANITLDTILKHGQRIRIVKNAGSLPQVVALAKSQCNQTEVPAYPSNGYTFAAYSHLRDCLRELYHSARSPLICDDLISRQTCMPGQLPHVGTRLGYD
jgi:hypothetical protein